MPLGLDKDRAPPRRCLPSANRTRVTIKNASWYLQCSVSRKKPAAHPQPPDKETLPTPTEGKTTRHQARAV